MRKYTKEKILKNTLIFLPSNLQTSPTLTHFILLPLITTEEMSIHLSKATPGPASGSSLAQDLAPSIVPSLASGDSPSLLDHSSPHTKGSSVLHSKIYLSFWPYISFLPLLTHISTSFADKTFWSCLHMLSLLRPCSLFFLCVHLSKTAKSKLTIPTKPQTKSNGFLDVSSILNTDHCYCKTTQSPFIPSLLPNF